MTKKLLQPAWCDEIKISEDQWAKLQTIGGVTLSAKHRITFQENVNRYREYSAIEAAAIRPSKIRPLLAQAISAFDAARSVLSTLRRASPPENRPALREIQKAAAFINKIYWSDEMLKQVERQLLDLKQAAEAANMTLPEDDHGNGDPNLPGFLLAIHSLFVAAGGRGVYTSRAKAFIRKACELAGRRIHSDGALTQAIMLARKGQKTSKP